MLNREQMMQILNTMDDGHLAQALSAVGIESGAPDEPDYMGGEADGLETWNAKDVTVPDVQKPNLVDKTKFQIPQQQTLSSVSKPSYGDEQMDGSMLPYLPQGNE